MFDNNALRRLILPLIAEQLLVMLVGVADTMMASYSGEAAISGVALVDMVNALVIALLTAVATGGAVIVSQYLGSREAQHANLAASQLQTVTLLVSLALTAICLSLHKAILSALFGAVDEAVMQSATTYFLITACSFPFLGIYNASAALYRSMGRTSATMYVSLLMNVVHIAGNVIGVFVLHAGVAGVAASTLVSRALAGVVMTGMAFGVKNAVSIRWREILSWNREMIGRILRIAVPNGIENGLFTLGRVLVTSIIALFGTTQIAANGVAQSVDQFAIVVASAMNLAVITVVGQCVGAKEYVEAEKYLKKLMRVSYAATAALALAVWAMLPGILGLYTLSEETWKLSFYLIMAHNVMAALLHPTAFNLPNGLRATGDARFTMVAGIASMLVFRLGTAYLLGILFQMGIWGVWAAMGMDWLGRSAVFALRFKGGRWREFRAI